jgi:hypothetical protein
LRQLPAGIGSPKNLRTLLLAGNAFPEAEQARIRRLLPQASVLFLRVAVPGSRTK